MEAKYQAPNFSSQTTDQVVACAVKICADAAVITGWLLPNKENEKNFYQALAYKLINDYGNLNEKEIKMAIINHCDKITNYYNKPINLPILTKVFDFYLEERKPAIEEEQKYIDAQVKENIIDIENIKNSTRELIEESYQSYLKGKYSPEDSLSAHIDYDTMVGDGIIEEDQDKYFLSKGLALLKRKYSQILEVEKSAVASTESDKIKKQRKIASANENLAVLLAVEREAKKAALLAAFYHFKKHSRINIYIKK